MPSLEDLENLETADGLEAPATEAPAEAPNEDAVADAILAQTANPAEAAGTRSESLAATREAKMVELFSGKHYTVLQEVHLEKGQVFQTPLGNKGRNGYVIEQVDAEGNPVLNAETGRPVRHVVGIQTLTIAQDQFGAVTVPPKPEKAAKAPKAPKEGGAEVVDPTA